MAALVGALRAMLTLDSTAFVDGARKAQRGQRQLESGFKKLQGTMKAFAAGMAVVGGALALAVRSAINDADMLGEMAEKIGVPVDQLSRLAYAAKITGVPLETLEKSLEQLSKKMVAAAEGGKAQSEMFADLGIEVVDVDGKVRSAEAVLQDLAGAFSEMPDGAEKTALAMEVFGKAGADMILMLNQGRDGLAALSAESDKFGLTISPETAAAAGEFNENIDRIRGAVDGLKTKMAAELLPVLVIVSENALDLARNFDEVVQPIKDVAAAFAGWFTTLSGLPPVLDPIVGKIDPIGAAFRTLGEAGGLLVENWAMITTAAQEFGNNLETYVTARINGLVAAFQELIRVAKEVGRAVTEALGEYDPASPMATFEEDFGMPSSSNSFSSNSRATGVEGANGLIAGFNETLAARMGEIAAMADRVTATVRQQWDVQSPSRVFREIGQFLTEGLSLGITDNVPMVDAALGEVTEAINGADGLQQAVQSMESTLSGVFVGLVTGAQSFSEALSQVLAKLAEMLAQAAFDGLMAGGGGNLLSGVMSLFGFADGAAFDGGKVTAFANGGIVDGVTAFGMQAGLGVMGEAGPEAIMPLTRIGGKLGVLAEGGGARVQLEISEGPMFASRVQTIAQDESVQVVKRYDRDIVPDRGARNRREKG